jgi:chemotaxis signal transduction protein
MRIGTELYALSVEHVLEIAEIGDLTPFPGAGAAVLGIRNLRGQVLPVFDLAALLGIDGAGAPSRLVVAETHGRKAGLAIDDVTDVCGLPRATEEAESELLAATVLDDGRLIGVIDVERVFAALEQGAAR